MTVVGYDLSKSPEWNVNKGRNHVVRGRRQSYFTVGHQLGALANEFEAKSKDSDKYSSKTRRLFVQYARCAKKGEVLAYRLHAEYHD